MKESIFIKVGHQNIPNIRYHRTNRYIITYYFIYLCVNMKIIPVVAAGVAAGGAIDSSSAIRNAASSYCHYNHENIRITLPTRHWM